MPSPKPVPLELSDEERQVLTGWTRRRRTALALRSRIVLECAQGRSNSEVAASLAVSRETISMHSGLAQNVAPTCQHK